jgi:hypothetical protein
MQKIYCFVNDEHRILLDNYFIPSFNKHHTHIDIVVRKFDTVVSDNTFGTIGFRKLMIEKVEQVMDLIRNNTDSFIVSDVDIEFFDSIHNIINILDKKSQDIFFQQEHQPQDKQVNTGFIFIKPNSRVANFWSTILDLIKNYPLTSFFNEQQAINISKDTINWGVFDRTIWNWTMPKINIAWIKMHHANCTKTVDEKIDKLNRFRLMKQNNNWVI